MVDKKTRIDLSLFLKILTIPVKKEPIPEIATRIPRIVSLRLLKNVSPPLSPKAINIKNNPRKIKKAIINPTDHLPKYVFSIKLIFIFFIS